MSTALALRNREQLPPVVADELDHLILSLRNRLAEIAAAVADTTDTDVQAQLDALAAQLNALLTLVASMALPAFTPGSVIFMGPSAALDQDNPSFFYDKTNHRIGFGTPTPAYRVDVHDSTGRGINIDEQATSGSAFGIVSQAQGAATTNTGGYFAAQSASTNYGVRIAAPGAGANNWALYADAAAQNYFAGNVGIGTPNPTRKLHLLDAAARPDILFTGMTDGASAGFGTIQFSNAATVFRGSLTCVMDGSSNTVTSVQADGRTGGGNAYINFYTAPSGGSLTEKMRINHLGNVGMGTTNPGAPLDIQSPVVAWVNIQSVSGNAAFMQWQNGGGLFYAGVESSSGGNLFTGTSAYSGAIGTAINKPLHLATNGFARLTMDASGMVTWGALADYGVLTYDTGLAIYAAQTGKALRLAAGGAGTNDLYITTGHNVGLGTPTPIVPFVVSNAGAAGFEFTPSTGLLETYSRSGAAYTPFILYGSTVALGIAGVPKLSIDATGLATFAGDAIFADQISTGGVGIQGGFTAYFNGKIGAVGGMQAGSGSVDIIDATGKIPAISSIYFASLSGANLTGVPTSAITGGAALTKADDTNVTLVLGGTPASALLAAVSLTLGWTGTLADTRLSTTAVGAGSYGSATTSPTFTVSATGRLTAASSVTITPAASSVTGAAALTKTDDTNVTLTLGGSPTVALLAAASITVNWSGLLSTARGGTGAGNFTAGSIVFQGGSSAYAQDNATLRWDTSTKQLAIGVGAPSGAGPVQLKAGGQTTNIAKAGGVLFDHFADATVSGTTAETDIFADTIQGSTLGTNGDKVVAEYTGSTGVSVGVTEQVRAYFGGTLIYDSTATSILVGPAGADWHLKLVVCRESSSVVRCSAVWVDAGGSAAIPYVKYTRVTGLTLSNNQILKVTGTISSAIAGSLTGELGYGEWKSAA